MNVLYGNHAVFAALNNPKRKLHEVYTVQPLPPQRCPVHVVPVHELRKHVPPGVTHQGIVLYTHPLPSLDIRSVTKGPLLLLDQITDPHNVGSLWRSAAAFGVQGIVMTKHHSPALDGVVAKVACGALEHVPSIMVSNMASALDCLKSQGFYCYGLCETGEQSVHSMDKETTAIVMGSEGKGLRPLTRKSCDGLLKIDTCITFPTLSVSTAGAIALHTLFS